MSLSTPFIERPVATTLLTIGLALAGMFAFVKLPVAPLPQVDFPTISVTATMPGWWPRWGGADYTHAGCPGTIPKSAAPIW